MARVIAAGGQAHTEVPCFWADEHGMNFRSAGAPLKWDEVLWRGTPSPKASMVFYRRDGATINQGRQMRHLKA